MCRTERTYIFISFHVHIAIAMNAARSEYKRDGNARALCNLRVLSPRRRQHDASERRIHYVPPRAAPPAAVALGKKCAGRNAMCAHGIRLPMQNPARSVADNSLRHECVHKWPTVLRVSDRSIDTHFGQKATLPAAIFSLSRSLARTLSVRAASFA
jgi:hypothetical protein